MRSEKTVEASTAQEKHSVHNAVLVSKNVYHVVSPFTSPCPTVLVSMSRIDDGVTGNGSASGECRSHVYA